MVVKVFQVYDDIIPNIGQFLVLVQRKQRHGSGTLEGGIFSSPARSENWW